MSLEDYDHPSEFGYFGGFSGPDLYLFHHQTDYFFLAYE